MGIGIGTIKFLLDLHNKGHFNGLKSVVEIGAQEMHLVKTDFIELMRTINMAEMIDDRFEPWHWPSGRRCSAEPFYQLLGIPDYACIDLAGMYGSYPLDLNEPLTDTSMHSKFDLVTDFGCCEHAFNIVEAYRTVHRLCAPSGTIVAVQSLLNGNGYYLFDHSFYEGISAANGYKILASYYMISLKRETDEESEIQYLLPMDPDLLAVVNWSMVSSIAIAYCMQKQSSADFKMPYQGSFLSTRQNHFGFSVSFECQPPARSYLPIYDAEWDYRRIKTKDLVRYIGSRLLRKLRFR